MALAKKKVTEPKAVARAKAKATLKAVTPAKSKKKATKSKKKATKTLAKSRKKKVDFFLDEVALPFGGAGKVLVITSSEVAHHMSRVSYLRDHAKGTYLHLGEALRTLGDFENLMRRGDEEKKALSPVVAFLQEQDEDKRLAFERHKEKGVVLYDDLYRLFRKDDIVSFADADGASLGGRVALPGSYVMGWTGASFVLTTKILVHDGLSFQEKVAKISIQGFQGAAPIAALPVQAMTPETQDRLTQRGTRVVEVTSKGFAYLDYEGMILRKSWRGSTRYSATGRCVIDGRAFRLLNENYSDEDDVSEEGSEASTVAPEDLYRVSPWLLGFSLAAKVWGEFRVENTREITFEEKAFEQLVLPTRTVGNLEGSTEIDPKAMIRSLVEQGNTGFTDVISGKGGGVIFLLHGPPGTGKTLTAEAVAELLHRPLYSVSIGELGTTTGTLEANLRRLLEVATLWNAVLLIDEADIFLEARTPQDIERNALVAIFLRLLEYYQGVMFLTTNRVTQFDEAFHSRISVALMYPPHNEHARKEIWLNLLQAAGQPFGDAVAFAEELGSYDLNGRQIKNAIRIGQSLAKSEGETLSLKHLNKCIALVYEFSKDLQALKQAT